MPELDPEVIAKKYGGSANADEVAARYGGTPIYQNNTPPSPEDVAADSGSGPSRLMGGIADRSLEGAHGYLDFFKNAGTTAYHALQALQNPSAMNPTPGKPILNDVANAILAVGRPMVAERQKAGEAFKKGRYAEGVNRGLASVIPIFGPLASQMTEEIQKDPWAGSGKAIADLGMIGAGAAAEGTAGAIGRGLKRSARTSMARGIGLPETNISLDFFLKKYVDPLIKENRVFWNLDQLKNEMTQESDMALTRKAIERAKKPEDFGLTWGTVRPYLEKAKDRFRTITDPVTKVSKPSGDRAIQTIQQIDQLANELRRLKLPPAIQQQVRDLPISELEKAGVLPVLQDSDILPFNSLENYKQDWQDFSRQHGAYRGKKVVGQTPEFGPEIESKASAADQFRPMLEENMTPEWGEANRDYHIKRLIAEQAEARRRAKIASPPPLAEQLPAGLGSRLGIVEGSGAALTGMPIRAMRRTMHSPGWNSTVAIIKDWLGDKMKQLAPGTSDVNKAAYVSTRGTQMPIEGDVPLTVKQPQSEVNPNQEYIWTGPGQFRPKP